MAKLKQGIISSLQFLNGIFRKPVIKLAANLVVLFFGAAYLVTNYQSIMVDLKNSRFQAAWLSLASLLTFGIVWTGAFSWWFLLRGFRQPVHWLEGCRIHLKSSVAKYIPGYAWQFLGKAYLTGQAGAPGKLISLLLVWEFGQLIASGLAISLMLAPAAILAQWGLPVDIAPAIHSTGGVLFAGIGLFPFAARRKLRGFGLDIDPIWVSGSALLVILGWLLLGLALSLTAAAFGFRIFEAYPFYVFTIALSLVAGILVIPVPNGLGVREGIMAYMLSSFMPLPVAVLISAVSRLEIVAGDFLSVLLVNALYQIRARIFAKPADHANTTNGLL